MYPAAAAAGHVLPLLIAATGAAHTITVHAGDNLSKLAAQHCQTAAGKPAASDWTGWYAANRAVIGADPDLIRPGQMLRPACYQAPATARRSGPAHAAASHDLVPVPGYQPRHSARRAAVRHGRTWGITYGYPNYCGDGDGDGWDIPCARLRPRPAHRKTATAAAATRQVPGRTYTRTYTGVPGSFQACVIQRESSGRANAVNPASGAGGLYGFLPSTWRSLGYSGLPENAPVWEQDQAFQREYALDGVAPWRPSDGC